MKSNKGIALVVALLAGALLLTVVLAVVANLSLSTRRVTGDQGPILQAKYAAESGLAFASKRAETMLDQTGFLVQYLKLPAGANLNQYAANFCNTTTGSPGFTNPYAQPLSVQNVTVCTVQANGTVPEGDRWSIFSDNISDAAYTAWNTKYPTRPIDKSTFWTTLFRATTQQQVLSDASGVKSVYQIPQGILEPVQVTAYRQGGSWVFRFEIQPQTVRSVGLLLNSTGQRLAQQVLERQYGNRLALVLLPPSFAQFAQFTDFNATGIGTGSERVWFYDSHLYGGPVHTNDILAFGGGSPWFGGRVSSAGCVRSSATDPCSSKDPNKVYVNPSAPTKTDVASAFPAYAKPQFANDPNSQTNPPAKDVNWNADYIPLPTTDVAQKTAAQNGGIYIDAGETASTAPGGPYGNLNRLKLWAAKDANGTPLDASDWDAANERWKIDKNDTRYQFIEASMDYRGFGRCEDPIQSISLSPSSVNAPTASPATVTVNISRNPNWSGPVYVDAGSTIPSGATIGGLNQSYSGNGTLTVSLPAGFSGGSVQIRAQAKSGAGSPPVQGDTGYYTADLTLNAAPQPYYNLNTASVTVCKGMSATVNISISRQNGHNLPVTLSFTNLPSGISISPANPTIPAGSSSVAVTVSAGATASNGTAKINAFDSNGTPPSNGNSKNLTITVRDKFAPRANNVSINKPTVGTNSGSTTVNLNRCPGYDNPIDITFSGVPTGVTLNPASVNDTTAGSVGISVIVSTLATPGTYTVTGTATSNDGTRQTFTFRITINGPSYTLSAPDLTVLRGANANLTVSISRSNGHNLPIGLSFSGLPSGVSITPPTAANITGNSASFSLSVSNSATPGTYTLTVNGVDTAGLTASDTFKLTIPAPDFALSLSRSQVDLIRGGSPVTLNVSVTPSNGFSGSVNLSFSGLPNGVTVSPASASVNTSGTSTFSLSASSSATLTSGVTVTVTGTGGGLTRSQTFTLTVSGSGGLGWHPRLWQTAALGLGWLTPFTTFALPYPALPNVSVPPPKCAAGKFVNPNYSFTQNAGAKVTYRIDKDGNMSVRLVISFDDSLRSGTGGTITADSGWVQAGKFNGVLYVDNQEPGWDLAVDELTGPDRISGLRDKNGNLIPTTDPRSAPPAIARFQQITIAAQKTIAISGDLKYEDPPCAGAPTKNPDGSVTPAACGNREKMIDPNSPDYKANILGLYSQDGDIRINAGGTDPYGHPVVGTNAPKNVEVHGVLMTSSGRIYANFNRFYNSPDGNPELGDFRLLGGTISKFYGEVGRDTNGDAKPDQGFGRRYTYDVRTQDSGMTPPAFPTFDKGVPPKVQLWDQALNSSKPIAEGGLNGQYSPRSLKPVPGFTRSAKDQ
ncbi:MULTISPECIES: DUF4900 domain-containing protein [unclassified Meiothermus]|uniref:DUF4900 domain-containing protein n=1 Tax=unclassified Meiothermus TaxID=370471 RepID=UPI000D7BFC47|nr:MULTISPECIES: DUF4900 domain-containing protein [unclassified Meiothermus]PZA07835.1 hypothetical protein DNA98_05895 [Meiothermus sp. Pnk-1]RYM38861.1 DUF4900 domain-containing protein [Meiothermus sp. PNK-Is4]